jgi:hypothetical protein
MIGAKKYILLFLLVLFPLKTTFGNESQFSCEGAIEIGLGAMAEAVDRGDLERQLDIRAVLHRGRILQAVLHNSEVNDGIKPYYVYPGDPLFIGEHCPGCASVPRKLRSGVVYFDDWQKSQYAIEVIGGLLYQNGTLMHTPRKQPFWTWPMTRRHNNNMDYVMSGHGEIFAYYSKHGHFHHSSAVAGGPVASAGELRVEYGVLKKVTSQTQHYSDNRGIFVGQFFSELHLRGVDLSRLDIDIRHWPLNDKYLKDLESIGIPSDWGLSTRQNWKKLLNLF